MSSRCFLLKNVRRGDFWVGDVAGGVHSVCMSDAAPLQYTRQSGEPFRGPSFVSLSMWGPPHYQTIVGSVRFASG